MNGAMIGGMQPVLTPREMAAADSSAISSGIAVADLMARAGSAVARAVLDLAGSAYGLRVAVVAGKGNNAGDGFVAAHRLALAGAYPTVVMLESESRLSPAAADAFAAMRGVRTVAWSRSGEREVMRADILVDAMVGTGSRGALEGSYATAARVMRDSERPTIAIDIPSGVDGLLGSVEGPAVMAEMTVTMGCPKTGLLLQPGASCAGEVRVVDIGIPAPSMFGDAYLVADVDVADVLWKRPPAAHKRSVGKVLVIGGSRSMPGAALLAVKGSFRGGAGLVRLAVPSSLQAYVGLQEALSVGLPETSAGTVEPSAVEMLVELSETMDAVVLGPGLSTHPETLEFVRKCVLAIDKPMVIDADGLNALAGRSAVLAERSSPTILTPHAMELARLVSKQISDIEQDRCQAARYLSQMSRCVVVSKGAPTLVADGETIYFVTSGGPALATAGTGDVLAGVAAAFASKMDPVVAAWASAHVHGRAGHLASGGRTSGVIASDVADALPAAIDQCSKTLR